MKSSLSARKHCRLVVALFSGVLACGTASAGPLALTAPAAQAPASRPIVASGPNLGGGFLELLFGGPGRSPQPGYQQPSFQPNGVLADPNGYEPSDAGRPQALDPRYLKQEVPYEGTDAPGTIVINTPQQFLYLVEGGGRALRYGIGVGRPGFTWAGEHTVTNKREWPDCDSP